MQYFPKGFLIGAVTAAHQVEGGNTNSDFWTMEQLPHSYFKEPSLDAVDHYHHYEEDILLLKNAGLNAYRFSLEWARIEPVKGKFDLSEIEHYRRMIEFCRQNGVEPIVTMHHFSSPKWLIEEGGWEAESVIGYFANYCSYVAEQLGSLMGYVCTINEANMGLQLASIMNSRRKPQAGDVQVGMNTEFMERMKAYMGEVSIAFGGINPQKIHTFLSIRTAEGDQLIMRAHEAARDAMKAACPYLKIGVTLSLHDFQTIDGSAESRDNQVKEWNMEFTHYLPYIKNDDFIGVQNYSRKLVGPDGVTPPPVDAELTQVGYEFYPEAVGNVIRTVAKDLAIPVMITENGIATVDDSRRIEFIRRALTGVQACIDEGIPLIGYMHWSLLDNFEWQMGFEPKFGLIAVERKTQRRTPKESLYYLSSFVQR
jgi:beta-glucosidase